MSRDPPNTVLFLKGATMSRLEKLNTTLVTVIVQSLEKSPPNPPNEKPLKVRVKELLAEPLDQMFLHLNERISKIKEEDYDQAIFLQYLLYNVLSIRVFSSPIIKNTVEEAVTDDAFSEDDSAKVETADKDPLSTQDDESGGVEIEADALASQDEPEVERLYSEAPLSPQLSEQKAIATVYEQLLNGEKQISADELKQQLVDLVNNVEKMLKVYASDQYPLTFGGLSTKTHGFDKAKTRFSSADISLSGALLQEKLFLSMGLALTSDKLTLTTDSREELLDEIAGIIEESKLAALRNEVATLTSYQQHLVLQLKVTEEDYQALEQDYTALASTVERLKRQQPKSHATSSSQTTFFMPQPQPQAQAAVDQQTKPSVALQRSSVRPRHKESFLESMASKVNRWLCDEPDSPVEDKDRKFK